MEIEAIMKKTLTRSAQFIRNPDVVIREEDPDGALAFNPDTDKIRVFNPTGFFIWQLCDGSRDIDGLIDQVRASFDKVPEDQVSDQIREFIEEMVQAGFIGTVEEGTAEGI